jgi:hypothetical protein
MMSCGGLLEPQTTSETPGYVLKSVDPGIFCCHPDGFKIKGATAGQVMSVRRTAR